MSSIARSVKHAQALLALTGVQVAICSSNTQFLLKTHQMISYLCWMFTKHMLGLANLAAVFRHPMSQDRMGRVLRRHLSIFDHGFFTIIFALTQNPTTIDT
jgi:hypothetical protein